MLFVEVLFKVFVKWHPKKDGLIYINIYKSVCIKDYPLQTIQYRK